LPGRVAARNPVRAVPKLRSPQAKPFVLDGNPKLLAKRQVLELLGCSANSLWRWVRAGRFPKGKMLGSKTVWLSTEVEAFVAGLPSQRLKPWEGDGDD
jgi:predicted DNA-binding transcriptional regulator AlpA